MNAILNYHAPENYETLFSLLASKPQAVIMAGGTDILVDARKTRLPGDIIDIKRIKDLSQIYTYDQCLHIGACVTVTQLKQNPEILNRLPALHQAAAAFGCYEIRNRATIGGSIMRASPGSEFGPVLRIMETKVRLRTAAKTRELKLSEFIIQPGKKLLEPGEILEAIILLLPEPSNSRQGYRRIARVAGMDLASVNAALLALNINDVERRVLCLAFGAVAPVPDRPAEVEALLSGKPITAALVLQAKHMLYERYHPRATSLRATPEYKKLLAGNILEMLLQDLELLA